MQITKLQIEIMKFVNECGFCTIGQVKNKLSLSKISAYRILKKLKNVGLVKHRRIIYESPGVYFLSSKGAKYSDLPSIDKISAGRLEHQIMVNDVFIQLTKKSPEANWISERRLMRDKLHDGVGKAGHICDGILVFEDSEQIAIEVELNPKGQVRIEKIIIGYITLYVLVPT